MKYIRLHKRLLIRGHTKKLNTRNLVHDLLRLEVVLVLNVSPTPDKRLCRMWRGIAGARKDIRQYLHVPMCDHEVIPNDLVNELSNFVFKAMLKGSVLVHCNQGRNRSALISIAALRRYTGHTYKYLIDRAREVRPDILKNKSFEKWLMEKV
jgi:protein-tyrosine phosphatase